MNIKKTALKSAEPATIIPLLTLLIVNVGESIGMNLSPAETSVIAGFVYGTYRGLFNFLKNRKR